jgi:phage terminase large subunit GpA-like protein
MHSPLTFQPVLEARRETFAAIIDPPAQITPAQWAMANLVVPDGPRTGEKWDATLTPYIVEPLDNMGPDSAVNEQAIQKSAQTGFTVMAIAGFGHHVDCDPAAGMLIVQPTEGALRDFVREKLNPAITATTRLVDKIDPQVARSADGSTADNKRYPGGSTALVFANSAAKLRSWTKKRIIRDEASEYPDDLDGQGSPHDMIEARRESFLASGDWKDTWISTPTIKGACHISDKFEAGDQRYWNVPCPGCGEFFAFRFGPHFRYNATYPYEAHYIAPCCGSVIEAHQKNELVRAGKWIATGPGPGKFPSYHFDALSSPFVPWDVIAKRYIDAQADPAKLKGFFNLTLGLPFEVKGDAPDHKILMARAEDYKRGHVPSDALLLTIACDVQMRGIYVEVLAWTPDRRSYVIEADYLDGSTEFHDDGAFAALSKLYHRTWPDAYGNRRSPDEFGVDSGYRSHVVYTWCRGHPGSKALKGDDGWGRPALGIASDVDIDYRGRKVKGGAKLRSVGTWPLKASVYAYLALDKKTENGVLIAPRGYCHFARWLDENYYKQLTAEYLAEEKIRGKPRKVWKQSDNDNHFLDCRVMNTALADAYLATYTSDDWARMARDRGVPADLMDPDLFNPLRPVLAPDAPQSPQTAAPDLEAATDPFAKLAELNKGL